MTHGLGVRFSTAIDRTAFRWPWSTKSTGGPAFQRELDRIKIYAYSVCGMEFEYDPAKSNANARKHGIDFETAPKLWQDHGLIVLPSRFAEETRFLAVGRIEDKHWTAIFTERGECIRLISVRRSRTEERELYERNQQR